MRNGGEDVKSVVSIVHSFSDNIAMTLRSMLLVAYLIHANLLVTLDKRNTSLIY